MADGSDKTSKGIQKRLKRKAHPRSSPKGREKASPDPSKGGENDLNAISFICRARQFVMFIS